MFRPTARARRGNILIVSLLMLVLFLVVGITFVYVARDQADTAITRGQTEVTQGAEYPDDGLGALNAFLSGFVYGVPNSGEGLINCLRGHDLMATMYGGRMGSTVPFDGTGLFRQATAVGVDRWQLVNYRIWGGAGEAIYDPEWTGKQGDATGRVYIPKNAAYTYPDAKDFYLGLVHPGTGEVLAMSYYRPHMFRHPSQPATATGLEATNPHWETAEGRYLILRPRPKDHSGFPAVPLNADGTTTGDVQNLPGGIGNQRNDSIWIDLGLPPIRLADGRTVKPLVAPLILDLDGRLNLSAHGNRLDAGAHASGVGLGPWEVNLASALPTLAANARPEGENLVSARGLAQTRGNVTSRPFAQLGGATDRLPAYAAVPWSGLAAGAPITLPGTGAANTRGVWPEYAAGNSPLNAAVTNHPSLFGPHEWPFSPAGVGQPCRSFATADVKILGARYADRRAGYVNLSFADVSPTSLMGTKSIPTPPTATAPSDFRLDPAHANRLLFTTLSHSPDRPGLMPGVGDLAANKWQSPLAALGPVDLNRQLADYRNNTGNSLGTGNVGNAAAAWADRNALARDIFARLIAATLPTGATDAAGDITINNAANATAVAKVTPASGVVTVTAPPVIPDPTDATMTKTIPNPDYAALRQLAQLAVNIVDYTDADDILTPFVWNPLDPTDPTAAANFAAAQLGNRVVFGIEQPRVVLNEAYAEVTNDPADMAFTDATKGAANPAHVRFWLELANPLPDAYGVNQGPLPAGGAALVATSGATTYSTHRIEIVRNLKNGTLNIGNALRDGSHPDYPGNVTGEIPGGVGYDIQFDFLGAVPALAAASATDGTPSLRVLAANVPATATITEDPAFKPTFNGDVDAMGNAIPNPTFPDPNTYKAAAPGAANSLTYTVPLANAGANELKNHVVLLRRLANPYLPPGATNPYVTVDYMDSVPACDAVVLRDGMKKTTPRTPKDVATDSGFDRKTPPTGMNPDLRAFAVGKVQPYSGRGNGAYAGGANPTFSFPTNTILAQIAVPPDGHPKHTLGKPNSRTGAYPAAGVTTFAAGPPATITLTGSADTLMTPHDWLVHLDRPLVNQLELLHVNAVRPYELTREFLRASGAGGAVVKHAAAAPWLSGGNNLYRALDLLRVQPRTQGTPLGGRVAGRININTITDKRVWDALFDARTGNFTQAQVDALWNSLIRSRTVSMQARSDAAGNPLPYAVPVPGMTVQDANQNDNGATPTPTPYDRPFLPFGAPPVGAGTGGALAAALGIDDTILRRVGGTDPAIWVPGATHPYVQAEAARKILNNLTTVSNTFAVYLTVGYFEVASSSTPTGWPAGVPASVKLGKEYYRDVPGDSRHKFFAVVDRSAVGLDPAGYFAATPSYAHANVGRPFFTTLEAAASKGATQIQIGIPHANGVPTGVNTQLVIGVGATREMVTATSLTSAAGVITVDLAAGTKYAHAPGECVSNIVPGNPGPQPNFAVPVTDTDLYRPVIPHWSRAP